MPAERPAPHRRRTPALTVLRDVTSCLPHLPWIQPSTAHLRRPTILQSAHEHHLQISPHSFPMALRPGGFSWSFSALIASYDDDDGARRHRDARGTCFFHSLGSRRPARVPRLPRVFDDQRFRQPPRVAAYRAGSPSGPRRAGDASAASAGTPRRARAAGNRAVFAGDAGARWGRSPDPVALAPVGMRRAAHLVVELAPAASVA